LDGSISLVTTVDEVWHHGIAFAQRDAPFQVQLGLDGKATISSESVEAMLIPVCDNNTNSPEAWVCGLPVAL